MFIDYKFIATEIIKDIPKRPILWTRRGLSVAFVIGAALNNPTQKDFNSDLLQKKLQFISYGALRNPETNNYLQRIIELESRGMLLYEDKWFFRVVRRKNFSVNCAASEAV